MGVIFLKSSSVSTKQKFKIRFREILELVLSFGFVISNVFCIFLPFVSNPLVSVILGVFAFAAIAHSLMTNTWDENCKGSFCHGNTRMSDNFVFLKFCLLAFTLVFGLFIYFAGLFGIVNPAVAVVLGSVSLATGIYSGWLFLCRSKNNKNKKNLNNNCRQDSDLSERNWLIFMAITCPIACALLLLSALAGILSFATAGACCIPFGGIGLFSVVCFLWSSKYREPNEFHFLNEDHSSEYEQMEQQVAYENIHCNNLPHGFNSQNQSKDRNYGMYNMNTGDFSNEKKIDLPSQELLILANENKVLANENKVLANENKALANENKALRQQLHAATSLQFNADSPQQQQQYKNIADSPQQQQQYENINEIN